MKNLFKLLIFLLPFLIIFGTVAAESAGPGNSGSGSSLGSVPEIVFTKEADSDVSVSEPEVPAHPSDCAQERREAEIEERLTSVKVPVDIDQAPQIASDHNAKLPFVVKTRPSDRDVSVAVNTQVTVVFNKAMDYLTINKSSIMVLDEVGASVDGNISYDSASYTATFSPRGIFAKNTTYSIFIPSYLVKDAEGNPLDRNLTVSFRTESREEVSKIYENRKTPRVVKNYPDVEATDVALDTYIMADFNMALAGSKVGEASITVNDGAKNIDGRAVYMDTEKQVLFIPGKNLEFGKVYRVTVNSGSIESLQGYKMTENYSWTFSTGKPRDEAPPEIVSTSPLDGSYDVTEGARITATFSEDIEPTSLGKYTMILSDGNQDIPGKVVYDKRTQKAAFVPLEKLKPGQKYNMLISTGVKDMAGNSLSKPREWTFTTKKPAAVEKPRVVKTYPGDQEKGVKIDSKIFVYFNKAMNEATCNVFNVQLTRGGKSIPVSTSFVKNGNFVTVIPLENLEYSTPYKLSVSSRVTDLDNQLLGTDFQFGFFTMEKPDTTPPDIVRIVPDDGSGNIALNSVVSARFTEPLAKTTISGDCMVVKNENGVMVPGSLQYDESENSLTFIPESRLEYQMKYVATVRDAIKDRAGNRLVSARTWSFTTLQAPDLTAPKIISCLPKPGEQMVPVNSFIQIVVSEKVKENAVNGKTFLLYDESGAEIAAAVTYDQVMRRVTITPRRNLEFGTSYKIVASKLLCDMASNYMKETFVSQFRTVPAPDRTRPELVSAKPDSGAINVSLKTPVSLSFSKKLDPLTVTSKNIFLRNENSRSEVPIEVVYNEKSRQIDIVPQEKLDYSTTYQAIVSRGVTDLAGNLFDSTIVLEFTTLDQPDVTPPEIRKIAPANSAKGVAVDSSVVIWFTKKIKDSTITENNISLMDVSGASRSDVFCRIAYDEKDLKAVVTPISKLKYSAKYKMVIKGITDVNGNALRDSQTVVFDTENEPDRDPPSVVSAWPRNNAKDVAPGSDIYVKFSEPIEPSSISADTFRITSKKDPVEFDVIYQPDSNAVVLKPTKPLAFDRLYTVEVLPEVADPSGNRLSSSYAFQFKTYEIPDLEKPKVKTVSPSNGAVAVSKHSQVQVVFSKKIKPSSANKYTIFITDELSGEQVDGKIIYEQSKNCAVFMPQEEFREGRTYRAAVTEGISDNAGNPIERGISWAFTVGQPKDNTKIGIVNSYPKNNELNVPVDAEVAITFSKQLNENTVNEYTIMISDGSRVVPGEVSIDPTGKKVVVKPKKKLKKNTNYIVTITNGLEDAGGQSISERQKLSFKTKI